MKKSFSHLLFLALLLSLFSAPALALDWNTHRVEAQNGSSLVLLPNDQVLVHNESFYSPKSPLPASLAIWQNGKKVHSLPFEGTDSGQALSVSYSKAHGTLIQRIHESFSWLTSFFLWNGNSFEPLISFPNHKSVWQDGNGYVGLAKNSNDDLSPTYSSIADVMDASGQTTLRLSAPQNYSFSHFLGRSGDSLFFALAESPLFSSPAFPHHLACYAASGELRFVLPFSADFTDISFISDGNGSAYCYGSDNTDYMKIHISRVSPSGEFLWTKTLHADRIVMSISDAASDPDTGNFTLYGSAVANSRKIYRPYILSISPNGSILSCDVRDFSKPKDYTVYTRLSPDGVPYVYNCSALIPEGKKGYIYYARFDELPSAENPGICLD